MTMERRAGREPDRQDGTHCRRDTPWNFALQPRRARTGREAKKQKGTSFLLIDMKSPCITMRPVIAIDGVHEVNKILLDEVEVPASHLVDVALAAICADLLDAMEALQHRAADMLVSVEQARLRAMYAMMAEEADSVERRLAIAVAKAEVNRSGRLVREEAVQLHGGIAMTWDHRVGRYFKRLTAAELLFGDSDRHLRALLRHGGLVEEV